ncbi:MAG: M23 family metallopeptidase [candidate division WOR-3 bacterium]|jgi:murein DD-endopeptidase MepM/ murein hydrolase activator NlpD
MRKFFQVIIITDTGKTKKFSISTFKWKILKVIFSIILVLIVLNIIMFFLNINTVKILRENHILKQQLAEFKKLEKEIEEFRKVKNSLYIALGYDKLPKDTFSHQNFNTDLVEQIDTPFGLPTNGIITQEHSKEHIGIDIASSRNSFVYATAIGKVIKVDSNSQFGLHVWLIHNKNYKTLYAHLSKVMVQEGDSVKRGQVIGLTGSSGHSTGPHIHYEVWKDNNPIDPLMLR